VREREITDLASLQAFTHPLRLRLLTMLRLDGPLTASDLARRTGESSGSTSYHLRQLERFGFVEDAPNAGSGRERHWAVTADAQRVRGGDFVDDPAGWAALGELVGLNLRRWTDALRGFIAEPERWPGWMGAVSTSHSAVRLSISQLADLTADVQAVIDRYEQTTVSPGDDDEIVVVYFGAVPVQEPS
jgi:DNA-binding transcriptional ArsR family regulator